MSSQGTRERALPLRVDVPILSPKWEAEPITESRTLAAGKQITVSESHPMDRKTGSYRAGGPFYTSRVTYAIKPGYVHNAYWWSQGKFYSGPLAPRFPSSSEMSNVGFSNPELKYGDKNESSLIKEGATAVHLTSPTNPASNLGVTLAETFHEGLPSLPGIQSWKQRTAKAKAAGSEYLNYQFGWAPLVDEVHSVVSAARHHKLVMEQYHKNEGRDTHRRFDFPSQRVTKTVYAGGEWPTLASNLNTSFYDGSVTPQRNVSLIRETKRWFEGCYTYALPSSTDSWKRALGFGSEAEQVYGLALSPEVLWELTPWSWAVDWFSNAGDVISNVTQFGLAGLVMRYGYIMEESIETITADITGGILYSTDKARAKDLRVASSGGSSSIEVVTKRRVPANPFGFGIGWEGLSPTQLAITAALGITRLL